MGELHVVSTDIRQFARDLVRVSANQPAARGADMEVAPFASADVAPMGSVEHHNGRTFVLAFFGLPAALFAIAMLHWATSDWD